MDETLRNDSLCLSARLEALLFVASGAVTPAQLASALDLPGEEIEAGLADLEAEYKKASSPRGLRLQRHHGRVTLTTAPEAADWVERFLGLDATSRLSRAALDTLAIIAYQQPVTRPQVDAIRGVNSDAVLKSLLSKGLIQEIGRAEAPGRPILYSTTSEFLQHFGLSSLGELPPLEEEPYPPAPFTAKEGGDVTENDTGVQEGGLDQNSPLPPAPLPRGEGGVQSD